MDWALSQPIPWRARECARAGTVHLGGSLEEITASERAAWRGEHVDKPFLLLSQPSLFDPSRAPQGKHTAWAYCHVPNGSDVSMLSRIEAQIERFAPGFRDCVLARKVYSPADLQTVNANLVGGDVVGGANTVKQFVARPTFRQYGTPLPGHLYVFILDTPRRRSARDVWLFRGPLRAETSVSPAIVTYCSFWQTSFMLTSPPSAVVMWLVSVKVFLSGDSS